MRRSAALSPFPPCRLRTTAARHFAPGGMSCVRRVTASLANRSAGFGGKYELPSPSEALKDFSLLDPLDFQAPEVSNSEPQEPGPEDCCQSGCQNCVWDIYRERHRAWAARNNVEVKATPAEDMLERLERELAEKAAARRAEASQDQG